MKLLFIDDNDELADSLRHFLGVGANITAAATGKAGLSLADQGKFDAIILDLNLPDMSGLDVCMAIRKSDSRLPIMILSGSKDTDSKVALFEAGADDYVTKPFTAVELRARIFALLRRSSTDVGHSFPYVLKVSNLTLDPISRTVERDGEAIDLRRKEFDILEYLMRNQDKIVTRNMIMDNVWEFNAVSWDGTINVHIKRLRDRVDRPFGQKLIKTAYGLGYTINDKI